MSDIQNRATIDGEQRLASYELKGKKLSFADRIANLSPEETPFTSMTGTESIRQTLHQWQTDTLSTAVVYSGVTAGGVASPLEGSNAVMEERKATEVKSNNTQIFRKALSVSDTANATDNYGRAKELMYQMDKASKELKRDIEATFLQTKKDAGGEAAVQASGGYAAGFLGNLAWASGKKPSVDWAESKLKNDGTDGGAKDTDTGAITVRVVDTANTVAEKDIFDMTYNLYLSGSDANTIMFHPKWASTFAALQESGVNREKIFSNGDTRFSMYVSEIRDPLGRVYNLIPNRWMPENGIYFLNAKDWTKMVLRPATRTQLAKTGSAEKWMIETELTLKHRHPFASGALYTGAKKA